jgi:GNAT superfamily N-acetyltransferase
MVSCDSSPKTVPTEEAGAMSYAVRAAEPGDLAAVASLLAPDADPQDLTAPWHQLMTTANVTVYVAQLAAEVIGTATLAVMPHITYGCRPTAFIEAVHVAPAHRRRGVARAMLTALLDDAGAMGCHKVQLVSHKRHRDDGGHALYRAVGFHDEAEGFRIYLD